MRYVNVITGIDTMGDTGYGQLLAQQIVSTIPSGTMAVLVRLAGLRINEYP